MFTVKVLTFDESETLPAASVSMAETVCAPLVSAEESVRLQVPAAVTTGAPATATPSMRTVTVAPGSPVPVTVGVAVLTTLPFAGPTTTGVTGARVSTVKLTGALSGVVPFASVAVAVATCGPTASAEAGAQENAPPAEDVVVHTTTPSTFTFTVTEGLVVPLKVGVALAVVLPLAGAVSVGVSGSGLNVTTTAWSAVTLETT